MTATVDPTFYTSRPTDDRIAMIMWDWFSMLNRRLDEMEHDDITWHAKYSVGTYAEYTESYVDEDGISQDSELHGNCAWFQSTEPPKVYDKFSDEELEKFKAQFGMYAPVG